LNVVVVVTAHFVVASTSMPIDQVSKQTNSSNTRHELIPEGFNFEINLQSFDSLEEVSEEKQ
jgi:hypothetical protein